MKNSDVTAVVMYVQEMCAIDRGEHAVGKDRKALRRAAANTLRELISAPEPTPGTGACFCKMPPEYNERAVAAGSFALNLLLDHRCPVHGERAQPALWGRHKEHELLVSPEQWASLGVVYPVQS